MSAAPSQKVADANVDVVQYDGDNPKRKVPGASPAAKAGDLSRKATLSAYMTIAAAAFGLISDGCMYSHASCFLSEGPER